MLQGVLSIQAGNNPRVVEMQLLSFLSNKQQAAMPKGSVESSPRRRRDRGE